MTNYKVMPEVPTDEMLNIGANELKQQLVALSYGGNLQHIALKVYEAMYAVSPNVECEPYVYFNNDVDDETVSFSVTTRKSDYFCNPLYTIPQTSKLIDMLMGIDEVDTTTISSDTPYEKLLKYLIQDERDAQAKIAELEEMLEMNSNENINAYELLHVWQACAEQYESAFKAVLEEKAQAKHDEEIANKYYHEAKARLKVAEDALEVIASGGEGQYKWSLTKAEDLANITVSKIRVE